MELPNEHRQDPTGLSAAAAARSSRPELASSIICGGCGTVIDASEPYPFRCPRSGDEGTTFCAECSTSAAFPLAHGNRAEPVRPLARLFHAYHLATANGMSDQAYVGLVRDLDDQVAKVDGQGFVVTPFAVAPELVRPLETSASDLGKRRDGQCLPARTRPGTCSGSSSISRWPGRLGMTEGPLAPLAIAELRQCRPGRRSRRGRRPEAAPGVRAHRRRARGAGPVAVARS